MPKTILGILTRKALETLTGITATITTVPSPIMSTTTDTAMGITITPT